MTTLSAKADSFSDQSRVALEGAYAFVRPAVQRPKAVEHIGNPCPTRSVCSTFGSFRSTEACSGNGPVAFVNRAVSLPRGADNLKMAILPMFLPRSSRKH